MIDEKTPEFAWPLPHAQNLLSTDVGRLREALNQIDQALTTEITDREQHAISTPAHPATAISVTPAGTLAATDVQAALNELDSEKQVALVSGTHIKTVNGASLLGSGDVAVQPTTNSLTEINTALADDDVFAAYDTSETAHKKSLMSRVWTYISGKITGAISGVLTSNLTASRAVVSDGSGKLAVSAATSTELGYLSGVTSAVQTQINAKAPISGPSFTSGVINLFPTDNGVDTRSDIRVYGAADINNAPYLGLAALPTQIAISSHSVGSVPFVPMVFYTGGLSRMALTQTGVFVVGSAGDDATGSKLQCAGDVNVRSSYVYRLNGTQVISARKTGWAAATGTATRTTFVTSTVTTEQLAQRVKALIDDLISHGLIGA